MESNTKMLETEIKIQKSFVHLVKENGFDKLSVRQLTTEAGISRGTFYLHYVDKYDLLSHYEDEIVSNITQIFERYPKPNSEGDGSVDNNAFYQLFRYLYRQRVLAALLLNESNTKIVIKVKQLIKTVIVQSQVNEDSIHLNFPDSFAKEMVSQGIIDFITYWLNSDNVLHPEAAYKIFQESRSLSPQQLTQIIINNN